MAAKTFLGQLADFYRAAKDLWGQCPQCGNLFRLSEAAISHGREPPRDWLRKLQKQQEQVAAQRDDLGQWRAELLLREKELQDREREIITRQKGLDAEARALATQMLTSDSGIKGLIKDAQQKATQRSRATLLGNLFERLGPFLQRFNHDPRDVRPLFNPVDYVCFDGLTVNRRVERIAFVEVKSGTARPSSVQKSIADAIASGRVSTEIWHFGDRGIPIEQQLLRPGSTQKLIPPPD